MFGGACGGLANKNWTKIGHFNEFEKILTFAEIKKKTLVVIYQRSVSSLVGRPPHDLYFTLLYFGGGGVTRQTLRRPEHHYLMQRVA